MDEMEFDSKGDEVRSRGILQKFNMLFQTGLNDELQTLLFRKIHRFTYDSAVKALETVAPEVTSFQKGPELIGRVFRWLEANGALSPADAIDRENWWVIGAPVRVKSGRAHHPGWIFSNDMVSGVVFYRRNLISQTWNCIYCPLFSAAQGDGPEMPSPIQSLAVRMILAKFPVEKMVAGKFNKDSLKECRRIYTAWKTKVNQYVRRMPWDDGKVQLELAMHYQEKALGHPLGPRGWDDTTGKDGEECEPSPTP